MMPVISAVTGTIAALTRRCIRCGHRQVVPASKGRQSVNCAKCGSELPPRKS